MEQLWNTLLNWLMNTGIKIVIALVLFIVSFKLINKVSARIEKKSQKYAKLDKTLSHTVLYVGKVLAKIVVVMCLVGYLGIDTSGLTALVTSLGVCAGLAVNGTLSNLAGGALLLITRPFKVDDYISVAGSEGTVEELRITTTKLVTVDNKVIYIPNSTVSTSTIVNYSEKALRRIDQVYTIPFSCDFEQAKSILLKVAARDERVQTDPAPFCRVTGTGSGNEVTLRVWVRSADYWAVNQDILEGCKKALGEAGIGAPISRMSVSIEK